MTDCVWEPLAEIEFDLSESKNFRIYCLCSRAFVRTKIKSGWEEFARKKLSLCQMNDDAAIYLQNSEIAEKHSLEMQNCNKHEREAVSCYCSASHYSTDDYDSALQTTLDQNLNKDHISLCPVQNSDSGADLSEHFIDKQICKTSEIEQFTVHSSEANLEVAWEKFWSRNGENIIWKSWIEKFGAYINPNYFERNFFQEDFNLHLNEDIKEHDINTECSATNVLGNALSAIKVEIAAVKEDNFDGTIEAIPKVNLSSYSSCNNLLEVGESVNKNPYIDESDTEDKILKSSSFGSYTSYEKIKYISSDDDKLKNDYERVRSRCSNASLSVKSIANTTVTTDSMTNVTKITLSSLDLSCECESIKSSSFLSTSSDDSSGSSSTSTSSSKEEMSTEADLWWRKVWKEHYQEQYKSSFEKFSASFLKNSDAEEEFKLKSGNKDEMKQLISNKEEKLAEVTEKNKFFKSRQYFNSVAYCLKRLEKSAESEQDEKSNSDHQFKLINQMNHSSIHENSTISPESSKKGTDNSDDSFDDFRINSSKFQKKTTEKKRKNMTTFKKRGNSIRKIDGIKQAMSLMGFSFNENSNVLQSGYVNYRKKNIRVQNRRLKLTEIKPKTHLFFDDDGNICDLKSNECTNSIQSMDEVPETFESDLLTLGSTCVDTEMLGYEAHSSSMEDCDEIVDENKKQRKKRRKLRKCPNLPQEIVENKNLLKYWLRRYQLFSKFDKGIKLDAESWFSVTPEKLAKHHAERCRCDLVVDAFCGAGGNSIQFAFTCERVIAIDIDPEKISIARHNARIYGVEERIEFIIGDFTKLAQSLRGDVVFLSPPWGGPEYNTRDVYNLDNILPPLGGEGLYRLATQITDDVAFFLPKNANSTDLALLSGPGGEVEIEQNFMDRWLRSVTAYFGGLIMDPDDPFI